MIRIKRLFTQLGFDGWAFLLCGAGAVIIAVLDFTQVVRLSNEDTLRIILVAIGLMMSAIVAQAGRRTVELQDLRDSLGTTSVELVYSSSDRWARVVQSKKFILDTSLQAHQDAPMTHPADNPNHWFYALYERLRKNEITYRRVEVIANKKRLEGVISRLLIFEGMNYLFRYYDAPSRPMPILNMMSFDNEIFYLGSFYIGDPAADTVRDAVIGGTGMRPLFEAYWNVLWHSATPLNEGKRINWDELKAIAHRVEMSEEEFNSIVSKWKDEVQRRKHRGR
jgi:hypothetical protein